MEIVVAADSDGRGQSLLWSFNCILKVLTAAKGKLLNSSEEQRNSEQSISTPPESLIANLSEMPGMNQSEITKKLKKTCEKLHVSDETLHECCARLHKEISRGLGKETNADANIKCFPTYVKDLPNGKECGRFLALDLGGTNFRVLLIQLNNSNFHMDSKIFAVPQDIMLGPGTGLFDHIAQCLATFIHEHKLDAELLPLGFTFSFPCKQEGLTKARLAQWTKGFKCEGVEGNDVVQLLKDALARRNDVKIRICAVLNDTTGTLMSCAWKKHDCRIGLIVGTGTNACYMEKLDRVELWDGEEEGDGNEVIINTEWGAFGDNGCLDIVRTQYDDNIDKESINPGRQLFEKMISGMYMGEIVRQVLVHLVQEELLFGGQMSEVLNTKGSFYTKYISEIEGEDPNDTGKCLDILEELGILDPSEEDCLNVRHVCECVSRRAARLAGAGVAVLLRRIDEEKVTVAVDGSVYRFHPHFHNLMVEAISSVVRPEMKFELMLSEDGSGRGAALVAAVACRREMENS